MIRENRKTREKNDIVERRELEGENESGNGKRRERGIEKGIYR